MNYTPGNSGRCITGNVGPETGEAHSFVDLEKQMRDAAENLDFERAIALRDQIKKLNARLSGERAG